MRKQAKMSLMSIAPRSTPGSSGPLANPMPPRHCRRHQDVAAAHKDTLHYTRDVKDTFKITRSCQGCLDLARTT